MEEIGLHLTQNITLPLYAIAVSLHSFAIYLLSKLPKRRNQDVIFFNISTSEICMCCCEVTQNIVSRVYHGKSLAVNITILIQCSLFVIPNILFMSILAIDRFGEIYFNIKYPVYISKPRLKIVLLLIWLVGTMSGMITLPLLIAVNEAVLGSIFTYIFPVLEGIFIIVAAGSYAYIYKKFYDAKVYQRDHFKSQSNKVKLNKKNFLPPFLILFNFMVFVIAPDTANLILFYIKRTGKLLHTNVLTILYIIGFINDAIIYIIFQRHLRKIFFKKLQWKRENIEHNKLAVIHSREVSNSKELNISYQVSENSIALEI